MISPGRLFWLMKRDVRRGWRASRHHYKTLPRIRGWERPFWSETKQTIPVHVLTGRNDWELAGWMLASWFHYSECSWPVVIHDDGTLPTAAAAVFRKLLPEVRVVSRVESDKEMDNVLRPFPFLYEYRAMHPLALKLFDVPHYNGGADRMIIFDSDLLFFGYPREILDWAARKNDESWFNEDVAEGSLVQPEEAWKELRVKLWPRVNSGLCLLHKPMVNFEFCDRVLAETSIMRGHIWRVEQTVFALCASWKNRGGLLPKTYEVSLGRHSSRDVVARHYVGAVRDRFYGEGLQRLEKVLLPE